MIFDIAPFPPIMLKSALKKVFMFLAVSWKFCTLSAALVLSGSSFQRRGAQAQNALSPNLFRVVCGICNRFLVFDLRVLVLACLTNSSLKYRGAHPCMHLKVKSRIFNTNLFLIVQTMFHIYLLHRICSQ